MTYRALTVSVDHRQLALRIADALQDLIVPAPDALSVFEPQPSGGGAPLWRVEAYYSATPEPEALGAALENLLGSPMPQLEVAVVPDLNWVALSQALLPPVRAGRFVIHGNHDRGRVVQGANALQIEAGEAFGTAHHASTFGCLVALDRLARTRSFRRILDLGCGSGVLAIAAARAFRRARIIAVDSDQRSVAVAIENARINGVARRVSFACGEGTGAPHVRRSRPFDLILANILAESLKCLAPALRRAIAPGGLAVLSGLLTHEAASVVAGYRAHGFTVLCHRRYDGWSTLAVMKRAIARRTRRP